MTAFNNYMVQNTSARSSSFLPLLVHATGMPGAAIWSGMLAALDVEPTRPAAWFCPAVSYSELFAQAVASLPGMAATCGEVTPSELNELSSSICPSVSLLAGPLDRGALLERPAPIIWEGAPLFVEILSRGEEPDMVILRVPGFHALARVPSEVLRSSGSRTISWFACKPNQADPTAACLDLAAAERISVARLTLLSERIVATFRRLLRQPLSAKERYCLRWGLAFLQECLWDAASLAQQLDGVSPGHYSQLLVKAAAAIDFLARAPSMLRRPAEKVIHYILMLGGMLAETEALILRFT